MSKPLNTAPFPVHIELESTNLCQLRCPFCPYDQMTRKKGFMSMETLEKVLEQAKGRTKTCYLHQIGEPLLHPKIVEMIKLVKAAGIRTSISTNAMVLDGDMAMDLFDSGLDELTLALDSLDEETYKTLRVRGDFSLVVKNIDRCLRLRAEYQKEGRSGPRIELQVIVMKANVHEIQAFRDKYDPMMEAIGDGESWLRVKGFSTFAGQVPDLSPEPSEPLRFRCKKLWESITINWNGDISLCCRDYDSFQVIGHEDKDKIEDIWHSPKFKELREQHRADEFLKDPLLKLCSTC